jgi:hypothetical protein
MRTHYWAIKGLKQTTPPNPGAILNFQVGFMWEKVVSDALRENKQSFVEQLYMEDKELNMAGTMDFARIDETGTWEVADSKTEGMNAASYRKREGKSFFNAHPEYQMQLWCYYTMLKRQGIKVSDQGKFIIIIKDNGLVKEEICYFTESLAEKCMNRINQLNEYLRTDTLPPCECEGWQIGYCGFGNPESLVKSKTGKMINSECCNLKFVKESTNGGN